MDVAYCYMIEYRLDVSDLAATRFAASPLHETVTSLWAWRPGADDAPAPRLAAPAGSPSLERASTCALLDAMVPPHGWLPDFLTPRPDSFLPDIADELAILRATPAERVRSDVAAAARGEPLHRCWPRRCATRRALWRSAPRRSLEAYWDARHRAALAAHPRDPARATSSTARCSWPAAARRRCSPTSSRA